MNRAGTKTTHPAGAAARRLPRFPLPRALWLVAAAAVVATALGLAVGLRGQASNRPGDPAELRVDLQSSGPLVIFSEFGQESDTLWAANPDDPNQRRELATVGHAPGFGIGPSLSPDGEHVAYVVLPPGVGDPRAGPQLDTPAELWVLDTLGGAPRRLAGGFDLTSMPVWAADSGAVVARQIEWREDGSVHSRLLRVDLAGTVSPLVEADAALFPIGFSPDGGWLYYGALSPSGSDLARLPAAGGPAETLHHLSDGISRDWRVSPDGARLAYLVQAPDGASTAFLAQVLDLTTGGLETPLPDLQVAQFAAVWSPDGGLTVGRYQPGAGSPAQLSGPNGIVTGVVRARAGGFDVPLGWSPDGARLAVRSFEGGSPAEPGPSYVEVVASDGSRHRLSELSDVQIAGWLQ